jgi:GNAT superfamily N-acetyltransferase
MAMDTTQADLLRDGTRLRLMDAAEAGATATELAAALGVPVTRIYHHIDRLVAADLLEVVDTDKRKAAVAAVYRAKPANLSRVGGKDDVYRALRDAERDVGDTAADAVRYGGRTVARMSVDQARELVAGVAELVDEIRSNEEPSDGDLVGFTYVVAPIARPRPPAHTLRPATDADLEAIQRIVYEAISWNPTAEIPPMETIADHPEFLRYHGGWGRPGDTGVLADAGGEVVAGAFYRRFTEADHGHGYINADTPEIAIAVWGAPKGKGIGSTLLDALHEMARNAGFAKVSLSVDSDNPARRLYSRQGYVVESVDEGGTRMVKNL